MSRVILRPIRIDGDIAYVPITKGYEVIIDASDAPLVGQYNWQAVTRFRTVYAKTAIGPNRTRRTIFIHRLIMQEPKGLQVDHKDGNGLDNRRDNLRIADPSQNGSNRALGVNNTSGYKGVSWHQTSGKWESRIQAQKKYYILGYFETPESAYTAYCEAAKRLHGDFARLR